VQVTNAIAVKLTYYKTRIVGFLNGNKADNAGFMTHENKLYMKKMLSGLLMLSVLAGCIGDEFDTDLLVDDVETTAGLAIPIAKTKVTMEDILSDQTDMVKYNGDSIILFQENDSVEYVGINDFFRLSSTNASLPVAFAIFNSEDRIAAAQDFSFSIPNASVSVMDVNYRISATGSNMQVPLLLSITFPTMNDDGNDRVIELVINNNQTASESIEGDRFALSDNLLNAQVEIRPVSPGGFYANTIGNIALTIDNLELSYVKGRMAENKVTMDEGSYALDFDVLDEIPGDIEFADPKLNIIIDNATPFKGLIAAALSGTGDIELASDPFMIDGKEGAELTKRTRYTLNNSNSNINEFISKTPDALNYAGELTLNPDGAMTDEVELSDADRIYIGYGFEVPLELRLNAELEEESVELEDIDLIDDLSKAALIFSSINGLPIGASAHIKFYDEETASVIETKDIAIVSPAKVNTDGVVTESVTEVVSIDLTASELESLKKSEELLITVRLNTSDYDKGQTVVFLKQNALEINLAIRGKVEYNN